MQNRLVLEIIPQFRVIVGDHPLTTFVAVTIGWLLLGRRPLRGEVSAGVAGIALFVAIACWYAFIARSYYDFAEPSVASVAWLFDRGLPVYHAVDAAERYSHIYGPLSFIFPGWFLAIVGPSLVASKLAGVLAGLFSLLAVYRLVRSTPARPQALALTGLFALLCLTSRTRNTAFWIRPDSFCLLFAALALLAATARRGWTAAVGVGICAGVLVNLKLTGPLYALPAFALVVTNFGVGLGVGAAGVTAAIVAAAPFVLFPNVSLVNYLTWVQISAGNGLLWSLLRQNLEWTLFLLLPLAWTSWRKHLALYAALLIGVLGVAIAASKPGAGPYHLLPFWPAVLYLIARQGDAPRAPFVVTAAIVACAQQAYFIGVMMSADDAHVDAAGEVSRFVDANPHRAIAMGYANAGERWTFVRPEIVFRTGRYPIDAPAVQEFEMSGLALPAATFEALRRCDIEIWLIPKGASPFEGPNKYPSTHDALLFPDSFKRAFVEAYDHAAGTDLPDFDVWRCRSQPVSLP